MHQSNSKEETIDSSLQENNSATWHRSLSNEYDCLAQGNNNRREGINTKQFIHQS